MRAWISVVTYATGSLGPVGGGYGRDAFVTGTLWTRFPFSHTGATNQAVSCFHFIEAYGIGATDVLGAEEAVIARLFIGSPVAVVVDAIARFSSRCFGIAHDGGVFPAFFCAEAGAMLIVLVALSWCDVIDAFIAVIVDPIAGLSGGFWCVTCGQAIFSANA